MKCIAEIEFDANPETVAHAQHVLNQWTKHNPLSIKVTGIIDE